MDNQGSYLRARERLEDIVVQVKSKDIPLEKSLDLYEEALRLGGMCAEMIDRTDFSAEELESFVKTTDEPEVGEAVETQSTPPEGTNDQPASHTHTH
jgi:exodeoxyribonuclease VII small subunit